MGGQPGGDPEAAGDERASERHPEVAAEPPELQHGAQRDVRPRHRTLLQGGGVQSDGEGPEDAGHPAGYETASPPHSIPEQNHTFPYQKLRD